MSDNLVKCQWCGDICHPDDMFSATACADCAVTSDDDDE